MNGHAKYLRQRYFFERYRPNTYTHTQQQRRLRGVDRQSRTGLICFRNLVYYERVV